MREAAKILRSKGFTLVEIMIVVSIILMVSAISIPGLLRARMNANETSAVASLKTICWAATTYRGTNPAYPANLSDLSVAASAYVDAVLGSGLKQGYQFNLTGGTNTYSATAIPITPNITGVRTFFVDAAGIIRTSDNGTADASSTPIE